MQKIFKNKIFSHIFAISHGSHLKIGGMAAEFSLFLMRTIRNSKIMRKIFYLFFNNIFVRFTFFIFLVKCTDGYHFTLFPPNFNMLNDDSSYFAFPGVQNQGEHKTSTTFLVRLQDKDSTAWKDFTEIYVPLIKFWCRQQKGDLAHAERQDILQEVLQSVSLSIKKFNYTREERSFRGWLRRITRNQINDHFREKAKNENAARLSGDPEHWNISIPSPAAPELDDAVDPEEEVSEQQVLLRQILKRIKPEFREKSWEVFDLIFASEKDSSEIAEMMEMTATAVRQLRSRILKRIREEYARLGIEIVSAGAFMTAQD